MARLMRRLAPIVVLLVTVPTTGRAATEHIGPPYAVAYADAHATSPLVGNRYDADASGAATVAGEIDLATSINAKALSMIPFASQPRADAGGYLGAIHHPVGTDFAVYRVHLHVNDASITTTSGATGNWGYGYLDLYGSAYAECDCSSTDDWYTLADYDEPVSDGTITLTLILASRDGSDLPPDVTISLNFFLVVLPFSTSLGAGSVAGSFDAEVTGIDVTY